MSADWLDRALARLDAEAIAETTAELVAIPSVGDTPDEPACLDHVAAWLADRAVDVDRWTLPAADVPVPTGWSCERARDRVPGLTASLGAAEAPGLLVNAHADVVGAADQPGWAGDPFVARRDGAWLVGRGAADTKGGLAAAMHVAAALAPEGDALPGRLVLSPVVGEEDGGIGTLASIAVGLPVTGAVVVEPTDLRVARATAGALRFRVSVDGLTAHGSVRHRGVSAIEKGWLVHRALEELERSRGARLAHPLVPREDGSGNGAPTPWPVCVGRIEGGWQPCDVADRLTLDGRLGVAPHEDPTAARAELEEAVARVAGADAWLAGHPPRVAWVGAQWLPAETPADDPLVAALADASGAPPVAMPYGCDAGLLRHVAGLPAVTAGPGSVDQAHAPEERVAVEDLGGFAELLLRGAARWWAGR